MAREKCVQIEEGLKHKNTKHAFTVVKKPRQLDSIQNNAAYKINTADFSRLLF